jgi:DNA-directed RNA polymerase subunit beta'
MANDVITPGALLIKSLLPEQAKSSYDPARILDKKGVQDLMSKIVMHGGDKAHESIQNLSRLFFNTATTHGYSTPLADYENDSDERQQLIKEFKTKVNALNDDSKLTELQRNQHLGELSGHYQDMAQKQNLKYMVSVGSTAGKMAMTGARGNPMQLAQGTFSPLMSEDIEGRPLPIPIEHSFAEGLTPAEHLAMSYGGRASTVKTQLSTSEPGALFKQIIPSVFHEVITTNDCHTENGQVFPVTDKQRVFNHVEAGTGRIIDDMYYKALVASGRAQVKIRTANTCEAKEGICQKCYGYDSRGAFPRIGENVGVVAAQSISEVLTQAMLATKHKGGVAGKKRDLFAEASNMLKMPENFRDEATLSTLEGTVTKVEKTPLGDHHVIVNDVKHFVPNIQEVTVKQGDKVFAGQLVSTGTANPKQLVALRGMGEGRKYLADSLREIYGNGLDPRHFDIVAKNLVRYVEVVNPGETGLLPGDIMEVGKALPYIQEDTAEVPTLQARGKKLAKQVLEIMPGTVLDETHVNYLISHGVDKVSTSKTGLEFDPYVKGVKNTKLLDKNWISRLSSSHLKNSIADAASYGEHSSIHSTDPITPYIMGTEFGEGKEGRY